MMFPAAACKRARTHTHTQENYYSQDILLLDTLVEDNENAVK